MNDTSTSYHKDISFVLILEHMVLRVYGRKRIHRTAFYYASDDDLSRFLQ